MGNRSEPHLICDRTSQRNLAAAARFREASRSHASNSPVPGECRSTNSPADGERPMLEGLKKLQGVSVHLPRRAKDYSDRDRLSLRFERFRAAH
jgi:hypothetical protein